MENFSSTIVFTLLPLVAGLLIFIGTFKNNTVVIRRFAKYFSALYFIFAAFEFFSRNTDSEFGNVLNSPFYIISNATGGTSIGFDTLGGIFALLVSFLILICFVIAKSTVNSGQKLFYSFVLFFESAFLTVLSTQDFCIFCAALLFLALCSYVLIFNFSPLRAKKAANSYLTLISFAVFILSGAFALVYAILKYNNIEANILNFAYNSTDLSGVILLLLFFAFALISAIKIPFFGFHLPILNIIKNSNPAIACIFLSDFILGFFIFIKFNMYILKDIFEIFAPIIAILSIFNLCYFAVLALGEKDLKKSFGYFCFSQSSIALCALCSISIEGICGAVLQCVSQSLILLGLFLCYCFVSQIFKTTKLPFMGALAPYAPKLAAFCFILTLAGIGIPFTSGFSAKFLCLLGGFSTQIYSQNVIWICNLFILIGLTLGAIHLITTFQKIFFGTDECNNCKISDLLRHRTLALFVLSICIIALGVAPYILTNSITKYADMIVSLFLM